ncbi:MAG: transposase [Synergistaceae bacterium]|nr:transposase [Synergistaceae bacterium]
MIPDKGYQGIRKIHQNSLHPIKRRKKVPLTDNQKAYNRIVYRLRFVIEQVNGILKRLLEYYHQNIATYLKIL